MALALANNRLDVNPYLVNPYLDFQAHPNRQRASVNRQVDPLYASGGFYAEPTPAHTATSRLVNPESSRNHLYTPSQVSQQGHANTPPRGPPTVFPTGRIHPNLPNYAPTPTPAVETRTRPTYMGPTPSAFPRTPTVPGPSTQALVLHRSPHTNLPQRVSHVVPVTANSHRAMHPYASTSTHTSAPAENARTTPTSVQSASSSFPRTPVHASFLPAQALAHLGAPQITSSGARVFYRPIPNQEKFGTYVRVNDPGQPDGYVSLGFCWQPMSSTHNPPTTRNQPTTPTYLPVPTIPPTWTHNQPTTTTYPPTWTHNQPATPTHPPTTYSAQPTLTSASSKACSPPQSANASELRRKAREYRALSDTLHASGDNKGAADAIAKANTEDGNAIRLERYCAYNAKRHAKRSAEETEGFEANRRAREAKIMAADNVPEQPTPSPQEQERP